MYSRTDSFLALDLRRGIPIKREDRLLILIEIVIPRIWRDRCLHLRLYSLDWPFAVGTGAGRISVVSSIQSVQIFDT